MGITVQQAQCYGGKTQQEMSKKLGVSLATYRKYEWGDTQMRIDKAKEFSKIVGIDIDQLIFLQVN